jgi:hypothetical protein
VVVMCKLVVTYNVAQLQQHRLWGWISLFKKAQAADADLIEARRRHMAHCSSPPINPPEFILFQCHTGILLFDSFRYGISDIRKPWLSKSVPGRLVCNTHP